MAAFPEIEDDALDYAILRDGGISLYRRTDYLEQDAELLRRAKYQILHFDCRTWRSEDDMHKSFSQGLSFPSYYGNNLDALDEVITDLDIPMDGGVSLVLLHYDEFANGAGKAYALAETVLDILSRASHEFLLTGRRFLMLVQSDDPQLNFSKLGGRAPRWNRREWLNKDRGL